MKPQRLLICQLSLIFYYYKKSNLIRKHQDDTMNTERGPQKAKTNQSNFQQNQHV